MTLRGIRPGDIVECRVRGAWFTARVRGHDTRGLTIDIVDGRQLPRGLLIQRVTARQVLRRSARAQSAVEAGTGRS
jgi:hypothetical protein